MGPFVKEQQSRAALLLVVPSERPQRPRRGDRFHARKQERERCAFTMADRVGRFGADPPLAARYLVRVVGVAGECGDAAPGIR